MSSQKWVMRHPLLSAVVVVVAIVLAASAMGITDAADQDSGQQPARKTKGSATYRVVHVVDGDTVDLGNGETVRLVGIDTPEIGECGYEEATDKLTELVGGRLITLGESDEDRDRYGRLLRYVDRGSVDAGLQMIESGLAIARYDSRDGYGRHPREDRYIRADERSPGLAFCGG